MWWPLPVGLRPDAHLMAQGRCRELLNVFARLDACQARGEVPDAQFGEQIVQSAVGE
jgi:hypothetical protein